jgi:hypothetical protein
MARTESEQLVFSVEARIAQMERQMARAGRTVDTTFTGMERRSKRAATVMEKEMASAAQRVGGVMKSFGKGLFAGIAVGGLVGVVSQISDVAKGMASIGDEAKRAGVSMQAFQELKFVAEQNRIGIDSMVDGLKEMSLRADEFAVTGKGSAAEAFQRLGYGAAELQTKLKDPSALLLEIIGRLGRLDKAAQIRVADEIFGGSGGERFVELINQGEAGIRKTIDRAHELGVVMSDDVIKKAAELDRRFNEIANTVGTALKSAIVSAADSLAEFIDGFRAFENQRSATLDTQMKKLGLERLEIEQEIGAIREQQAANTSVLAQAENRLLDNDIKSKQDRLGELAKSEAEILAILNNRTKPMQVEDRTWTPPSVTLPGGNGGGSGRSGGSAARSANASAIQHERDRVKELIAELEQELSLVNASDEAKRAAASARQAGAAATAEERERIIALNESIYQEEAALDRLKQQKQALAQTGEWAFGLVEDGLSSVISGSEKASDAVKRLGIQIALAAAKAALFGNGPLASLLGEGSTIGTMFNLNLSGAQNQ